MATQTITARTVEQHPENAAWVKTGQKVGQVREKARGPFDRVGEILWRVSLVLRPLLQGFAPPYGMQCLLSEQLPREEKRRIKAELTIGP